MKTAIAAVLTTLAGFGAVRASAQSAISSKARIMHVEGSVYLDGKGVQPSAAEFPAIIEDSVMRTEEGRAEVLLAPGVTLRLGKNGSFRMIGDSANDTRIEVLAGPAVVLADQIHKDTKVTVVCEEAVTLSRSGAYRFDNRHFEDIRENFCQFKVYSGAAEVQLATLKVLLTMGQMMDLNRQCGDHIQVNRFAYTFRHSVEP